MREDNQDKFMFGSGELNSVFEALSRAAAAAAREEDRWLSADEIADMMGGNAQNVRNECIRLIADGRVLVRNFRRGCAQIVPRFRVKPNDVLSGVKGGDTNFTEAEVSYSALISPRNDPPHRITHPRGGARSKGSGRKKDG